MNKVNQTAKDWWENLNQSRRVHTLSAYKSIMENGGVQYAGPYHKKESELTDEEIGSVWECCKDLLSSQEAIELLDVRPMMFKMLEFCLRPYHQ